MSAEIAKLLLDLKAVALRTDPPFTWTSGIKSPIYTDNRLIMSYVEERVQVIAAFLDTIHKTGLHFDGVAATATAGITWGAWIAGRLEKPMVYVRGSAKGHGKENAIEGHVEKDKTYLVVEDLISTGKSSRWTAEQIREAGGKVADVLAIFTYELPKAEAAFSEAQLTAHTLTTFSDLVSVASDSGYLEEGQKETVLKWKENPEEWSA